MVNDGSYLHRKGNRQSNNTEMALQTISKPVLFLALAILVSITILSVIAAFGGQRGSIRL
jgi:hypothetical protein